MTKRSRQIKNIEDIISTRRLAARAECSRWFGQFTEAELKKLADGEEEMTKRACALGAERIEKLIRKFGVFTNDEISYLEEHGFEFSKSGKVIKVNK